MFPSNATLKKTVVLLFCAPNSPSLITEFVVFDTPKNVASSTKQFNEIWLVDGVVNAFSLDESRVLYLTTPV